MEKIHSDECSSRASATISGVYFERQPFNWFSAFAAGHNFYGFQSTLKILNS